MAPPIDDRNGLVSEDRDAVGIANRDRLARTPAHDVALACVKAGIRAATPDRAIRDALHLDGDTLVVDAPERIEAAAGGDDSDAKREATRPVEYDLSAYDEVVVLGGGKAAAGMAGALEGLLGEHVAGGAVVTTAFAPTERVAVIEGDHPVPTERTVAGTEEVLKLADAADERTLVVAALSGGGSALLTAPAPGLTLDDLRETTRTLLASGAAIDEINALRKHCSAIKGGALARLFAPATTLTLLLCDVVGDDPSVIASGPTVPDDSTYADALDVLERYDLVVPSTVAEHLRRGVAGELSETPGSDDPAFERTETVLLASGRSAIDAARNEARRRGYEPTVLTARLRGEACEVGTVLASIAEQIRASGEPVEPPAVVLAGGETTVTVREDGVGGPNQELALAAALEFASEGTEAVLASVDTDGIDGSSDAAGALVDRETVAEASIARRTLGSNDAGRYLDGRDALIETGWTGTNVNDLLVLVVED